MQPQISQLQLQAINKRTLKYPLDIAEKDYYLTLALKLISESPLASRLVFKGGTALHHCYLPQYRFSEDLDFTTPDKTLDADTVVNTLTRGRLTRGVFTLAAGIAAIRTGQRTWGYLLAAA